MSVPSYPFHSLSLKLPNKGMDFPFPPLKLPNKRREEYSKIILFIPFHSIPFSPSKRSLRKFSLSIGAHLIFDDRLRRGGRRSYLRRFWLPKEPVSLALTLWFSFSMKALGFRSSTILVIPSPKLLIGFVICSALSVLRILNSTWYSIFCVCKFLFCLVTEKMREKKVRN